MSERASTEVVPKSRRRFLWIAIAVVAVILVGSAAGLVAAALSSHSSTPSMQSPAGSSPAPLNKLPGGTTRPGFGSPGPGGLGEYGTPVARGTVERVSSTGFTVTAQQGGSYEVTVTSSTRYVGAGAMGLSSLKKGDAVVVFGKLSGTSSVTASVVASGMARPGLGGGFGQGRGLFGSITSVGTNEFTVTSTTGVRATVKVTSSTGFFDSSGSLNGLSALKSGESVLVRGTVSGSVVTAIRVLVMPAGAAPGFGGGAGFGGAGL